jgi:hypothetical protein
MLAPKQERRHRNLLVTPRVGVSEAADRLNILRTNNLVYRRNSPVPRRRPTRVISDPTPHVPIDVDHEIDREPDHDIQDIDVDVDAANEAASSGVAEIMTAHHNIRDDSSGDEEAEIGDDDDDWISEVDDETDEDGMLSGLSAWDELGENFAHEIAEVGECLLKQNKFKALK